MIITWFKMVWKFRVPPAEWVMSISHVWGLIWKTQSLEDWSHESLTEAERFPAKVAHSHRLSTGEMCSWHGSYLLSVAGHLYKCRRKGSTFYDLALEFTCHHFLRILIIKHESLGAANTQEWSEFCFLKGGASNLWTDFNTTSNLQWMNYLEQKTLVVVWWCQKLPEMLVSSLKVIII